jgi:hypothetical protein
VTVNPILATALLGCCFLPAQQGAAMPSEQACADFARRFTDTIAGDDPGAMDSAFDFRGMLLEGVRTADLPADFKKELESGAAPKPPWGGTLKKQIAEKGSYTLLRIREQGGVRKALFRIISPNGVNYHDYHLTATEGGGVKVSDIYVYQTAERLSETFRRMMVSSKLGRGDLSKPLTRSQTDYIDGLRKAGEAREVLQKGDPAEYLRRYAALPRAVQREKGILVLRTMAASQVGEKEALEALEDFKKTYPGDPCIDLVSIDPLTKLKKYDQVIDALDRLEKSVGGDPYLDFLRASVHLLDEKAAKAKECARRCVEREPSQEDAYWLLVQLTLKEKAWAETVQWLSSIEKTLKLEIGDLSQNRLYEEFLKTPEYKAWLKSRAKK